MPTVLVSYNNSEKKNGASLQSFTVNINKILYDELERQGLELPHGCLSGSCGSCRIEVVHGVGNFAPMGAVEKDTVEHLQANYPGKNVRLSCRAKVLGDVEVIPLR